MGGSSRRASPPTGWVIGRIASAWAQNSDQPSADGCHLHGPEVGGAVTIVCRDVSAQEALKLYRELTEASPVAYLPGVSWVSDRYLKNEYRGSGKVWGRNPAAIKNSVEKRQLELGEAITPLPDFLSPPTRFCDHRPVSWPAACPANCRCRRLGLW